MSTNCGPRSGECPVRLIWSVTATTDPGTRSSRMPPTAAVSSTVEHPAAMPVRSGCTTSVTSMPSYRWQRPPKTRTIFSPIGTDQASA